MTLEQAGKKMPFDEKDGYVERLVKDATENAIRKGATARTINMRYVVGIAATVLLLFGVTLFWYVNTKEETPALAQVQQQDPLGQFLNSISDEEAQMIEFYEIEEIYY